MNPKSKLCVEIRTCNLRKSLNGRRRGGAGGGVGKKYYGMMDVVGKLGEFQSRLQNSSADEITAGNFAIPTIEGWLDTDTLSALLNSPFGKRFLPESSVLSVPMQVVPYQSRVTLCSISGITTTTFGYSFISTFA